MKSMTNTIHIRGTRPGNTLAVMALVAISISAASAQENFWTGDTNSDWNDAANWSLGIVPTGQNAVVDSAPANIATISSTISATPNDIIVRGGGRLDHVAGTAGTGGGSWMFIGQNDTAGTYNLADTSTNGEGITGFGQGSGSLNATGNLLVGAFGDNRTGTVRVNTSGTLAISGELFIGDSLNSVGTFLLESGTMTVNNKIFVGNNRGSGTLTMSGGTLTKTGGEQTFVGRDNGTGTLTQSGGTITLNHDFYVGQGGGGGGTLNISGSAVLNTGRDFVIGREGGTGELNMTGGTITKTGDEKFIVGHNNGTGTVVQSGGIITANNELYIGNENASALGTYTLSGGSLSIGKETAVGRQGGTGTLTQSGGTITLSNNLYVGQSSGSDGTVNISSNAVLNVGRDFVIGREGGTGELNMTGGTITKTGDEKFLVGHNNGTGTVVQSGGTITANNELYIGNENAGASGTYTLSGTGALTVSNEVVVGRESGTGVLNVDGGTITTEGNGNMYIGRRGGTGTLNQTAGTISVNREFGVGTRDDNKIGTGTYNLSGGSLAAANNIFIGKEQGSSGTMTMTGGTMSTSDKLQIGHNQATGVLTQSGGTINVQNEVYIGNENSAASVGTYTLSGTGVLNVGNEVFVGRDNGTGTFNLDGGTVNANKISGGSGSATVNFNGGVIRAKRDEANLIENLDTANVDNGGIKIDSNGFNVATSQALSGTGGLEKSGSGSLTLSGASANTFTGMTTVSAGTLRLNKTAGTDALAGDVTVNSGAFLLISQSDQVVNNANVSLSGGTITRASGVSEVFGSLNLTDASFLDFGTGTTGSMTLGTYEENATPSALLTLNNFIPGNSFTFSNALFAADGSNIGSYFTFGTGFVDRSITANGGNSFTITAIPEPSTYLAAAGLLSLLLWPSRRRVIRDTKKILGITPPMRDRLAPPRANR